MGRTFRTVIGLAPIAALALVFSASAQAHHDERFQLFGTASIAKDPNDPANQVVEIDTTAPGSFGGVFRDVNTKITSLDDHLSVLYYFVAPKSCNQGSTENAVQAFGRWDIAFGHIGPAPAFTACAPNRWIPEDLTISMRPARRLAVHVVG